MSALSQETANALASQLADATEARADETPAPPAPALRIFTKGEVLPEGAVIIDEFVCDGETGEEIGILAPRKDFVVDTVDAAEWVMERMSVHDGEIAALKNRLIALQHNLQVMIKDETRRRNSLEQRFGLDVSKVAEANLPKGKKTWTCPYGQVAFTTSGPKFKLDDEPKAMEWALVEAPECIKTEPKFMISLVSKDRKAEFIKDPKAAELCGFKIEPGSTTWKIDTGVA